MTHIPSEKHYSHKERPLDRWINLANLLPPQESIPEPSVLVAVPVPISAKAAASTRKRAKHRKQKERAQPGWVSVPATTPDLYDAIERARKAWNEQLTALPRFGGSPADRYGIFYRVRETLRDIVQVVRSPRFPFGRERKRPGSEYETMIDAEIRTFPTARRQIAICRRGIVLSEDSYGVFLNLLFDAERTVYALRFCPICSAIFLPRRKDQKACSPRCANVLRVRNQRKYEKTRQRAKDRKQKKRRTER